MSCLSKVDVDLLQYHQQHQSPNTVNLYIGTIHHDLNTLDILHSTSVFSKTIQLSNTKYLTYHLSSNDSIITLYPLNDTFSGRTIHIHLPSSLMNKHHTLTVQKYNETLLINSILKDGSFLTIDLPLNYILSNLSAENIDTMDWFSLQNPYDFTIRIPHLLYSIDPSFQIVFLKDGGLLGLKKINDLYFEPILFNDTSYLKSLTRFFTSKQNKGNGIAISCTVFQDKYLLILTQDCHLKIWNLDSFSLLQDYDLVQLQGIQVNSDIINFDTLGTYLYLFNNILFIYLPFGNGFFSLGTLLVDQSKILHFNPSTVLSTNLSTASIWSFVDMMVIKPLDLNIRNNSFLNLIVLWKSESLSKLQILNIKDESLQNYEWINSTNKSLKDTEPDYSLNITTENINTQKDGNIDTDENMDIDVDIGIFELKLRYSEQMLKYAKQILNENGIDIVPNKTMQKKEYLDNLNVIIKDIKNKFYEPCSLSIYGDEIIMINCSHFYNYSVYKLNTSLENIFFNNLENTKQADLSIYLKNLNDFTTTLSKDTIKKISRKFIDITSGNIPSSMYIPDNFTEIFKTSLENQFDFYNLEAMLTRLNSLDVTSLLDEFIENKLIPYRLLDIDPIPLLNDDSFSKALSIDSLYQLISIHHIFTLQILLSFLLFDFDITVFEKQLNTLLNWHYKQSLFLQLYQQNKVLLSSELLKFTSLYSNGVALYDYDQINSFSTKSVQYIYDTPIDNNLLFLSFFKDYIINVKITSHGIVPNTKNITDCNFFQSTIEEPFYLRQNILQEFMFAMTLFVRGEFDQAYEFFQLHYYSEAIGNILPSCLNEIAVEEVATNNIWQPLLSSFNIPYNHSAYYYELSCLFEKVNSRDIALKCISESVQHSMEDVNIEEPTEFKERQHIQYLDLLIGFGMFREVLDILRLGHDNLSIDIRNRYFKKLLLENTTERENFFQTLLKLCRYHQDQIENDEKSKNKTDNKNTGLYLSISDFKIIDSILCSDLKRNNWGSFMRVYSFRMLNLNARSAIEIIYEYLLLHSGPDMINVQKRCYLIIINVLAGFEDVYDQWIAHESEVITLSDLRANLKRLEI